MWVRGVGTWGAGLDSWPLARAVLRAERERPCAQPVPPSPLLPPAERRRASEVVRLAMATASEAASSAGLDPASVPTVFATSSADGGNCNDICEALASPDPQDHLLSPTRFHNSVQNAAAGYWAIATHAMAPSTNLSAYDGSYAAALLEAAAMLAQGASDILAVVFDVPYPPPLAAQRPIGFAFASALALSAEAGAGSLGAIRIGLTQEPAMPMADAAFESLRCASPAARGLPLLLALAQGRPASLRLEYLDDLRLAVELRPA
jgi:hypothetical protein